VPKIGCRPEDEERRSRPNAGRACPWGTSPQRPQTARRRRPSQSRYRIDPQVGIELARLTEQPGIDALPAADFSCCWGRWGTRGASGIRRNDSWNRV